MSKTENEETQRLGVEKKQRSERQEEERGRKKERIWADKNFGKSVGGYCTTETKD